MQQLTCVSFLLGLAILLAALGPFVAIAHRELPMLANKKKELVRKRVKLEHSVEGTKMDEEIKSKVSMGPNMGFRDAAMEAKDVRSKATSGEIKNDSTNSGGSSDLKDHSSSTMKPRQGSTPALVNLLNPQQTSTQTSKPSSRKQSSGSKEFKDLIALDALYDIQQDWKEKMLEASDEVLKLLNRDYGRRRRRPIHN